MIWAIYKFNWEIISNISTSKAQTSVFHDEILPNYKLGRGINVTISITYTIVITCKVRMKEKHT